MTLLLCRFCVVTLNKLFMLGNSKCVNYCVLEVNDIFFSYKVISSELWNI